jgi:SAM-dependent methyltransferase
MLDITYGNTTQDEAQRLDKACYAPDSVDHEPGCTEPWISQLVGDFVIARGARTVLETGCFKGATSVYVYDALRRLWNHEYGDFAVHLCDIDPERAMAARNRIDALDGVHEDGVGAVYLHGDVLAFLQKTEVRFDLAWVDDCHEKPHVTKELMLLMPKMNPGGLILLHDVYGVCDLKTVVQQFGGYSLDLPRLGPAGGLGIIQV